jgi:hypothetical protein
MQRKSRVNAEKPNKSYSAVHFSLSILVVLLLGFVQRTLSFGKLYCTLAGRENATKFVRGLLAIFHDLNFQNGTTFDTYYEVEQLYNKGCTKLPNSHKYLVT